jgi:HEPN domain-containing protein
MSAATLITLIAPLGELTSFVYNSLMADRSEDWLRQAEADLQQAEASAREKRFEWSCFASHQAGEKAMKALILFLHGEPWGHSISMLIRDLPAESAAHLNAGLTESAKALDKHYIPTRYPNGFDSGAPMDYYTERDAREAINHARSILAFCQDEIRQSRDDSADRETNSEPDSEQSS